MQFEFKMVNPFQKIGSGIPSVFPHKEHPLKPLDNPNGQPIETNKFYTNMLLDQRTLPAFPHPYSVWWSKTEKLLGIAVSHVTEDQRVFGQDPNANPCQYYFNPAGIQSVNFGAAEWTDENAMGQLSCSESGPCSVKVQIRDRNNGLLTLPLVSGLGFVTGVYEGNITPQINSLVGFQNFERQPDVNGCSKYKAKLFNQLNWVMYASNANGIDFKLQDGHIVASGKPNGKLVIQWAKLPDNADSVYDSACGCYATSVNIEGDVNGKTGTYRLKYSTTGGSGKTVIMALPHQVESFSDASKSTATSLLLDSTTMGKMTACVTNCLEMVENDLPVNIGFLPWTCLKNCNEMPSLDGDLKNKVGQIAKGELDQDMKGQCSLDSMYFSGKGFDKFAFVLLVTKYLLKDDNLTKSGLEKLKQVLQIFIENKQQNPLVYDTDWRGLISIAGYNDPNADFGNTYYNDHHFHYGYFFHAAAVIGQIDKEYGGNWLSSNKDWINALVRDTNNPSTEDTDFPVSRSFDWFAGHSWAKGLFISGDGKDEESTSEDYHFAYGVKMWGKVIGDEAMEARGNLMLAIMKRAMNKYMIYSDDNCHQPQQFIKNKVAGITFENKIDHATYFGLNPEYIQGIHMIPITPVSSYVRSPTFVKEEWDQIISRIVDQVDSGWKGILKLNQALYDPSSSFNFFNDANFKPQHLDPGMSLTWCLAYSKLCQ